MPLLAPVVVVSAIRNRARSLLVAHARSEHKPKQI